MQEFTVETAVDEQGRRVVSPRGEIDVATYRQLREVINELLTVGHVHVVVDLSETAFLDSTALGALIGARRRAHALKGSFAIRCDNPKILQVFRMTGLDRVFVMEP